MARKNKILQSKAKIGLQTYTIKDQKSLRLQSLYFHLGLFVMAQGVYRFIIDSEAPGGEKMGCSPH